MRVCVVYTLVCVFVHVCMVYSMSVYISVCVWCVCECVWYVNECVCVEYGVYMNTCMGVYVICT